MNKFNFPALNVNDEEYEKQMKDYCNIGEEDSEELIVPVMTV